jgi:SAM-dependent methyltransferase
VTAVVTLAPYPVVHEHLLSPFEKSSLARRRDRLLASASGLLVEIGGGLGANLERYPAAVERAIVFGVSPANRPALQRKARRSAVPVELRTGALGDLDVAGGSVGTVVSVLTLCAVPDLDGVLAAVRRLLSPEGRLLFVEHVPATGGRVARSLAAPAWEQLTGGCRLDRDLPARIRHAGFVIADLERFTVPTLNLPLRTCAAGIARPAPGPMP